MGGEGVGGEGVGGSVAVLLPSRKTLANIHFDHYREAGTFVAFVEAVIRSDFSL